MHSRGRLYLWVYFPRYTLFANGGLILLIVCAMAVLIKALIIPDRMIDDTAIL